MGKVMVVDDAQSVLRMIESILRPAGHHVVSFADPEKVEERIVEERPDVLLLDVVMPKRNGYEVLRRIRRDDRIKKTPVVLVTSKNQPSDELWGRRQGADEYVSKPFTPEQLLGAIKRFVA